MKRCIWLIILITLLSACQQEKSAVAEQQYTKQLVEQTIAQMQAIVTDIRLGETTDFELDSFTASDSETYVKEPYEIHIQNGLVDSITLTIDDALTLNDTLPYKLPFASPYHAEWIREGETVTALRLTRSEPTLQQQIASMPLDEKIGQLILTGFDGTTVTPLLRQAIEEAHIGHVILFSKNITSTKQLMALNKALLQLNTPFPLWITVDEEGGRVSRMPNELTTLPSAARLVKNYSVQQIEGLAQLQGELLHALGFSVNFAPVLDVNSNPRNPVIGERAFSSDVKTVNNYTHAFINGLQQAGVLAVGKHFPGHGDTMTDSHVTLPVIHKTKAQLQQTELAPFQYAIDHGIQMLMVGHLLVPALDANIPASYSSTVMHDLLREEMGFNGVIITDDLTMQAIDLPVAQAAVKAIIAGADIALIGHGTEQAILATTAVMEAVQKGQLTEQQLNARVYRILSLKAQYYGRMDMAFNFASWNKKMNVARQNN